jgi:hypothetical protein
VTEFAFNQTRLNKPEFLLKTFFLAAASFVDRDAMEDIHLEPGNGTSQLVSLLETYTTQPDGANHILYPLAATT